MITVPRVFWVTTVALLWLTFATLVGHHSIKEFIGFGWDFDLWFSMGQILKYNLPEFIYVNGSEIAPPYVYSPFATPFFWPLSLLPHDVSKLVFGILRLVLFATWPAQFLLIFRKCFSYQFSAQSLLWAALPCVFMLPAIHEDMIVGNINIFITSGLLYALNLCLINQFSSAAFVVTMITAFKPQYTLFLLPLLSRSLLPTVRGGILAATFLFAFALLFFSPELIFQLTKDWLFMIQTPLTSWQDANNMSVQMVLQRWFSEGQLIQTTDLKSVALTLLAPTTTSLMVSLVKLQFALVLCAALFASLLKRLVNHGPTTFVHTQSEDPAQSAKARAEAAEQTFADFAVICMAVMLISPLVWQTHLIALVLPVALSACRVRSLFGPRDPLHSRRGAIFKAVEKVFLVSATLGFGTTCYTGGHLWNAWAAGRDLTRANALPVVFAALLFYAFALPQVIKIPSLIRQFFQLPQEQRRLRVIFRQVALNRT